MSSSLKVVHLSATPLVGAPSKISSALNQYTRFQSSCLVGSDYPGPIKGLFVNNTVVLAQRRDALSLAKELIEDADLIHVHNDVAPEHRPLLDSAPSKAKFVYHLHSSYREGPLFFPRHGGLGVDFSAHLSIPHFPQQVEPEFQLVPNLILHRPSLRRLEDDEVPRILFSPSHKRSGQRWGDKVSPRLSEVLSAVEKLGLARVTELSGVPPHELFEIRRRAHISIDEIVTGGFHQVSLEGLACGNVVVNAADPFQTLSLQSICGAPTPPPFYHATESIVHERLLSLLADRTKIRELQEASYDYYTTWLRPEKLIRRFTDIYSNVLESR